ncbi:hypothetical protein BGZ97_006013 [Linnemannia gamsii]|jgi:hypothetical protein|uniref:C2H2-type domain-containing protein n=1 Tax=Linnemannia gamsii TaxID=64522 RepID=A0A9P6QRR7_9FUNG|nr:hypothetical protein BGZ97_006013 [Linnemannia gamsii]
MQVHPSTPNHYYTTSTTQQQQHPYNPNMFASTSSPQYTLLEQQQQQQQQQQPNEDMFFALERLLMGISPFPPTMPTLAKPTCPSLDDQLMAEMSSPSPSSTIPSIVLNEQSLDMLQQFYQNQDSQHNHNSNNQYSQQSHDQSDCSSTSRSGSPPASPYSYASSLVSSPAMPILDHNNHYASMVAQQQHHYQQHDYRQQQFEQMSMPLNLPPIEAYMAPSAALLSHSHSNHCQHAQPLSSVMPTTTYKNSKSHHRRSSSSASSAISAYESTASRGYRASSISSVCSATSTSTVDATTLTKTSRPVKSYACPTCTKPFPTRTQLKSHMAIHTDLFPFPCQYAGCELHFKRKHDLRRHVDAKHALVKKYLCTGGCGEGFGRRDQMVRHLRRGTCGKGFQTE